jgi:hypothetical protein
MATATVKSTAGKSTIVPTPTAPTPLSEFDRVIRANFQSVTGIKWDASEDTICAAIKGQTDMVNLSTWKRAELIAVLVIRGLNGKEASDKMGVSAATVSTHGARGRFLLLTSESDMRRVWDLTGKISSDDLESLWNAHTGTDPAALLTMLEDRTVTRIVAARLARTGATREQVDAVVADVTAECAKPTVAEIAAKVLKVATAKDVPLEQKRETGKPDAAANAAPTLARAHDALLAFVADREAGSTPETPFALTDEEKGTAAAMAAILTAWAEDGLL